MASEDISETTTKTTETSFRLGDKVMQAGKSKQTTTVDNIGRVNGASPSAACFGNKGLKFADATGATVAVANLRPTNPSDNIAGLAGGLKPHAAAIEQQPSSRQSRLKATTTAGQAGRPLSTAPLLLAKVAASTAGVGTELNKVPRQVSNKGKSRASAYKRSSSANKLIGIDQRSSKKRSQDKMASSGRRMIETTKSSSNYTLQHDYYSATEINWRGQSPANSMQRQQQYQATRNQYEENILLQFATEHGDRSAGNTPVDGRQQQNQPLQHSSQQRLGTSVRLLNTLPVEPDILHHNNYNIQRENYNSKANNTTTTNNNNNNYHLYNSTSTSCGPQQADYSRNRPSRSRQPPVRQQVGKFVTYYPAERQPRAQKSRQTSPYAFHVPLPTCRSPSPAAYYQQQSSNYKGSRQITPNRQLNRSLRSRTLAHIPSVDSNIGDDAARHLDPYDHYYDNNEEEDEEERNCVNEIGGTFDEKYDDPYNCKASLTSANDLLKAHVIRVQHPVDQDNPFRPGTELSLEADIMVRLIKRGYPIQELPNLVKATKEVARETLSKRKKWQSCEAKLNAGQGDELNSIDNSTEKSTQLAIDQRNKVGGQPSVIRKNIPINFKMRSRDLNEKHLGNNKYSLWSSGMELSASNDRRKQSKTNLDACKQTWTSGYIARAKSLPRVYSSPAPAADGDADSLDKLIINIEQEISHLMRQDEVTNYAANEENETSGKIDPIGQQVDTTRNQLNRDGNKTLLATAKRQKSRESDSSELLDEDQKLNETNLALRPLIGNSKTYAKKTTNKKHKYQTVDDTRRVGHQKSANNTSKLGKISTRTKNSKIGKKEDLKGTTINGTPDELLTQDKKDKKNSFKCCAIQ